MNPIVFSKLAAVPGDHGTPTRKSTSTATEKAAFRDALSMAERGGRQRHREDVSEPRAPLLTRLADRLEEAMRPLGAREPDREEPDAMRQEGSQPEDTGSAATQVGDPPRDVPVAPRFDHVGSGAAPGVAAAPQDTATAQTAVSQHGEGAEPRAAGAGEAGTTRAGATSPASMSNARPDTRTERAEQTQPRVAVDQPPADTGVSSAAPIEAMLETVSPAAPDAAPEPTPDRQQVGKDAALVLPDKGGATPPPRIAEASPAASQPTAPARSDDRKVRGARAEVHATQVHADQARDRQIAEQAPDNADAETAPLRAYTSGGIDAAPAGAALRSHLLEAGADGKPVTIIASRADSPSAIRAPVDVATAVRRTLASNSGAAPLPDTAALPSVERPSTEGQTGMRSEATDVPPTSRPTEKESSAEVGQESARETPSAVRSGSASVETLPPRVDAPPARPVEAAPSAVRPGVTASSILAPLIADPLLRSALARMDGAMPAAVSPAGTRNLQIQLRPVELGAVTATLRITDDRLKVELQTENAEAYRQLSNDSDTIVNALRGLGLQVDQITVQPPQPGSAASTRPEGSMPTPNSGNRDDAFAQAGSSSGGNSRSQGGDRNEGGQNGAPVRQPASTAQEARNGRGLVI